VLSSPRPFVLYSYIRTGGTFLAHCLDSHPDIFMPRHEPFRAEEHTMRRVEGDLMGLYWEQPGYVATGCKVTYSQATPEMWHYLGLKGGRIIHLTRNPLQTVVSIQLRKQAQSAGADYPTQRYERSDHVPRITVHPPDVRLAITNILEERTRLAPPHGLPTFELTYDDITGGQDVSAVQEGAARMLCRFLDVPYRPLTCRVRRVNPAPLSQVIVNWEELRRAFADSPYAEYLREENPMSVRRRRVLNLGTGHRIIEGAVNHDRFKHHPAIDIAWDLKEMPWPWEDNSFDFVSARSVLEHIPQDLVVTMNELWRIIAPGGHVAIRAPYWDSPIAHRDPTHYWCWDLRTFDNFDPDTKLGRENDFLTPYKWRIKDEARLDKAGNSILVALAVRK